MLVERSETFFSEKGCVKNRTRVVEKGEIDIRSMVGNFLIIQNFKSYSQLKYWSMDMTVIFLLM